jgi:hypothetical protein
LLDQRFDAAQTRRDPRNPHGIDDVGRGPPVGVLYEERHETAKPAHCALGHVVVLVRLETGIKNLLDPRMAFEELGHALPIFVVTLHPQLECFEAAG